MRFLERLHERNEYYIASHHPLRETILNQTGVRESLRMQFLNRVWNAANRLLGGSDPWEPT
ncbi:hypothetical protein CMO84_10395 [Candidatus Woesearchaeota archaeon]|nr:hypothetical protein [Candidatus Woesearchaeota archaeon]